MKNGFKAMDSDMHVMEPCDLWQKYIDPRFADRAPVGLSRHKRDLGIQVEGKIMPRAPEKPNPALAPIRERLLKEKYTEEEARNFDNVAQLRAMDKEGLDAAILYPSRGLFVLAVDGLDPELAAAIAKAYNDWMHDFCKVAPGRMYGAGIVAPHDVSAAVEETRRVVKELGFRSVLVRPNHVNGRMWSDPYYDPLWEECQKLGIPIGFHEAGRVYLPQPALSQFIPSFTMFNTLSFPMANMFACADMIYGGVMERFPRLKVAFLEGNCSWIPWLLGRFPRRQLFVDSLAALAHGRIRRTDGSRRAPRNETRTVGILPAPVLGLHRVRRGSGEKSSRLWPGRQHCLLNRLPAPGREISPRGRKFFKAPVQRPDQEKISLGQLRAAVRLLGFAGVYSPYSSFENCRILDRSNPSSAARTLEVNDTGGKQLGELTSARAIKTMSGTYA
ncbi:MAG: amidohydrolase family protein [Deltaproteobacteria bacterium]|nr:amidohydrolase family protein [Deltaproteobacteria bacterium]